MLSILLRSHGVVRLSELPRHTVEISKFLSWVARKSDITLAGKFTVFEHVGLVIGLFTQMIDLPVIASAVVVYKIIF